MHKNGFYCPMSISAYPGCVIPCEMEASLNH